MLDIKNAFKPGMPRLFDSAGMEKTSLSIMPALLAQKHLFCLLFVPFNGKIAPV
jgi:hypothetical protein